MIGESPKIPIAKSKADATGSLELGGRNLAVEAAARHPVDLIQRTKVSDNPFENPDFLRATYGSGLAMELAMERQIANKEMRMHQNSVYNDIVTGKDISLQLGDVMGLPDDRPELPMGVLHPFMEQQLK